MKEEAARVSAIVEQRGADAKAKLEALAEMEKEIAKAKAAVLADAKAEDNAACTYSPFLRSIYRVKQRGKEHQKESSVQEIICRAKNQNSNTNQQRELKIRTVVLLT